MEKNKVEEGDPLPGAEGDLEEEEKPDEPKAPEKKKPGVFRSMLGFEYQDDENESE